jgi:hypothetical protein
VALTLITRELITRAKRELLGLEKNKKRKKKKKKRKKERKRKK